MTLQSYRVLGEINGLIFFGPGLLTLTVCAICVGGLFFGSGEAERMADDTGWCDP